MGMPQTIEMRLLRRKKSGTYTLEVPYALFMTPQGSRELHVREYQGLVTAMDHLCKYLWRNGVNRFFTEGELQPPGSGVEMPSYTATGDPHFTFATNIVSHSEGDLVETLRRGRNIFLGTYADSHPRKREITEMYEIDVIVVGGHSSSQPSPA